MAGAGLTWLVLPTGALEIGVVLSGAAILAALALVAMQPLVKRRLTLTRVPKPWKKTGALGEVKRVPSSLSAELAFPLLQAENAISEDAEFNTNDANYPGTPGLYQASGLYSTAGASPGQAGSVVVPAASPPRPVVSGSPFSPQPRALCEGEGVWVEGMYLCVVTEPMPPFAIVAASRGWLQFCGFDAKEVKGRTLSMLQGPATERVVAAKLVSAAHQGVATDAVLVNYTKHCLAFRNHVRVHPFTKDGVLEGFKVITTSVDPVQAGPAERSFEMWSNRASSGASGSRRGGSGGRGSGGGGGGDGGGGGGGGGDSGGASASASTSAARQVEQEGTGILRAMRAHARTNRRAASAPMAADADAVTDDEQRPTRGSPEYARASAATPSPAATGSRSAPLSPTSRAAADAWWDALAVRSAASADACTAQASSAPQGALHSALLECCRKSTSNASSSSSSSASDARSDARSSAREPQPWPPPRGGDKAGDDAPRTSPSERNVGASLRGRTSPSRPADVVSPLGVGHGGLTVTAGRDGVARRNLARAAEGAASVPSSPWSHGGVLRPEDKSPFLPSRKGVVRSPQMTSRLDNMGSVCGMEPYSLDSDGAPAYLPPAAASTLADEVQGRQRHAQEEAGAPQQPRPANAFKRRGDAHIPPGMLGALAVPPEVRHARSFPARPRRVQHEAGAREL